ncbi:MAG TPA: hypothetical protein VLJ62_13085 [Burkholderiaceae bacterium]|nr:hypothetical protein [Burkholderiaceae bacterium]
MKVLTRPEFQPCVHGAFGGGLTRAAYFDGMVLTAADMQREQLYWRSKRKLSNRALGEGVVWGLGVAWDGRQRAFTLSPGYGLSCCGEDLVVECPQIVSEAELIDVCGEDFRCLLAATAAARLDPCNCDATPDGPIDACLLLEYVECPEDPRSVFEDPCAEHADGCRSSAMRETTRLRLVPPPPPPKPGALDLFCRRLDAIRDELEKTQPAAVMPPLAAWQADRVALTIAVLDAAGTPTAAGTGALPLEVNGTASALATVPAGAASLRLGLEPPPGAVFASVEVDGVRQQGADVMMGSFVSVNLPFPGGKTWSIKVELVPLLSAGAGSLVELSLALVADIAPPPGTPAGRSCLATVLKVEALPPRADCTARLAEGLTAGGCTLRGLALALLTGWFKGALLSGACAPRAGEAADLAAEDAMKARLLAAWAACRIAWRALYGIDLVAAQGAGLEKCLQQLFAMWCEGLHYKGPRCDRHAHGIILGCLQITPKGRVLCFDEWCHRRHVLTGPLLSHWAGQFGLPPLDVSMGRLARWICCLASSPLPALPDGALLPEPSLWAMAGGLLHAGKAPLTGERINGAKVDAVKALSTRQFIAQALEMLSAADPASAGGSAGWQALSAPGGSVHLLRPVRAAGVAVKFGPSRADLLVAELDLPANALPKVARLPMRDFVAAFAEKVQLAQLKPRVEVPLFEPMVEALEAAGVASLADLVELGPEPALRKLRDARAGDPVLADARATEKAIAIVHDTAVKALTSAGQAIVEIARAHDELDPFTRAELLDAGTLNTLRKATNASLRDKGLTPAELKAIASTAASA